MPALAMRSTRLSDIMSGRTTQAPAVRTMPPGPSRIADALLRNPRLRDLPARTLASRLNTTTDEARRGIAAVVGTARRITQTSAAQLPTMTRVPGLEGSIGSETTLNEALAQYGSAVKPMFSSSPASASTGIHWRKLDDLTWSQLAAKYIDVMGEDNAHAIGLRSDPEAAGIISRLRQPLAPWAARSRAVSAWPQPSGTWGTNTPGGDQGTLGGRLFMRSPADIMIEQLPPDPWRSVSTRLNPRGMTSLAGRAMITPRLSVEARGPGSVRPTGYATFVIRSGDYPVRLAKAFVDDERRYTELSEVNPQHLDSGGQWTPLYVGEVINLPHAWVTSPFPRPGAPAYTPLDTGPAPPPAPPPRLPPPGGGLEPTAMEARIMQVQAMLAQWAETVPNALYFGTKATDFNGKWNTPIWDTQHSRTQIAMMWFQVWENERRGPTMPQLRTDGELDDASYQALVQWTIWFGQRQFPIPPPGPPIPPIQPLPPIQPPPAPPPGPPIQPAPPTPPPAPPPARRPPQPAPKSGGGAGALAVLALLLPFVPALFGGK